MRSLRLLVTEECNLRCSYCCNNIPEQRQRFKSVHYRDLDKLIEQHEDVCITGGEPMLFPLRLHSVMRLAQSKGKRAYLYTNGLLLHGNKQNWDWLQELDGINLGLHSNKGAALAFGLQEAWIRQFGSEKVRVRLEDRKGHWLHPAALGNYELWKMNECDTDEDVYVIDWEGRLS